VVAVALVEAVVDSVAEALVAEVLAVADRPVDGDFIYYLIIYYLPFITFVFITNQLINQSPN
jgi:hypothetical protein